MSLMIAQFKEWWFNLFGIVICITYTGELHPH